MKWMRGWLLLEIRGREALRFLNLCKTNEILLWEIATIAEPESETEGYAARIGIKDLYRIRPLIRKTRVKVAIRQRCGLPFLLYKQRRNRGFFLGLIMFASVLFYSQTLVWGIYIDGNYTVTDNQLQKYLWDKGVYVGMKKKDILYNLVETEVLRDFEEVSWCSLKLENGNLHITINENAVVELQSEQKGYKGMNLAANVNGKIEELVVREGVPNAKKGQEVQVGDVIVVGRIPIMEESGEIKHFEEVTPSAKIAISYDYAYKDEIPRKRILKEYTGRCSYGIRWKGKNMVSGNYAASDIEQVVSIPIGNEYFTIFRQLEYQKREYLLDDMMAENILREKLEYFLDSFIEKGVQIIANDVKIIGSIDSFQMEGVIRMQGEFDE